MILCIANAAYLIYSVVVKYTTASLVQMEASATLDYGKNVSVLSSDPVTDF